jgi:hypothetical protein
MTPRSIHAICADYRASFFLDRDHDAADRANGRRISAPTLVVTGTEETQLDDAPAIWRSWAAQVSAELVPGHHVWDARRRLRPDGPGRRRRTRSRNSDLHAAHRPLPDADHAG